MVKIIIDGTVWRANFRHEFKKRRTYVEISRAHAALPNSPAVVLRSVAVCFKGDDSTPADAWNKSVGRKTALQHALEPQPPSRDAFGDAEEGVYQYQGAVARYQEHLTQLAAHGLDRPVRTAIWQAYWEKAGPLKKQDKNGRA